MVPKLPLPRGWEFRVRYCIERHDWSPSYPQNEQRKQRHVTWSGQANLLLDSAKNLSILGRP